jgi:hypothetical protein
MWREIAEISWFIFIIVIAVVAGLSLFPAYQYWSIPISLIIIFFGAIFGYILFEHLIE